MLLLSSEGSRCDKNGEAIASRGDLKDDAEAAGGLIDGTEI